MVKSSLWTNPATLPLQSIATLAASPALVVAPHPDDECLGCGGAIALLRSQACQVYILVISDGTRSHPNSLQYPAPALRLLRESETRSAMATLGVSPDSITFLGLPDGSVPMPADAGFSEAVTACQSYLEAIAPQLIFLPWRQDPHADHRASWQIVQAALKTQANFPRLVEYPIWDWDAEQRGDGLDQVAVSTWRLEIQSVLSLKQEAIAAYRSQISNLINDDPQGFRLTADMLNNFMQPWEVYIEASVPERSL